MARLVHRSLSNDNEFVATRGTTLGAAIAALQAWRGQSVAEQEPRNWCADCPSPTETIPMHIPISNSPPVSHSSSAATSVPPARHPQPALPSPSSNTPAQKEQLEETLAACRKRDLGWLPALGSHAATVARSDAPTVPRLGLLLGCLHVPVADASLVSALCSSKNMKWL